MTDTTLDPFAPPESAIGPADPPASVADGDFFAVFRRWEKYRLAYNGILGLAAALVIATRPPLPPRVLFYDIPVSAVFVNVCFCLGPVLNGYAWRMGLRDRWVGRIILAAGTLPSILMTYGVLSNA